MFILQLIKCERQTDNEGTKKISFNFTDKHLAKFEISFTILSSFPGTSAVHFLLISY